MLVRFSVPEEDLALCGDDAGGSWRAAVPRRVVCVWRDTLRALPAGSGVALHDYLSTRGYTACFAAILRDSGHLVDSGPRETLKFYALTHREAASAAGLCVDPAISVEALRSFGLNAVAPQLSVELASGECAALQEDVARRCNSKGAVMYGYGGAGVVVRMWRLRSHAFAMERAVQEAIVTHRLSGAALRSRVARRLAGCRGRCAGAVGDVGGDAS
ncbi:hypothetical protein TRSC58_02529, partial [Trypanosoma rangeli SC58]